MFLGQRTSSRTIAADYYFSQRVKMSRCALDVEGGMCWPAQLKQVA